MSTYVPQEIDWHLPQHMASRVEVGSQTTSFTAAVCNKMEVGDTLLVSHIHTASTMLSASMREREMERAKEREKEKLDRKDM
jgi:hypothetical protein